MFTYYKKTSYIFFLSILFSFQIFCQGQVYYNASWERDGGVFGTLFVLTGLEILGKDQFLEADEISTFDRSTINRFDRGATFNYDVSAAKKSDRFRDFATLAPLSLLVFKNARKEVGNIGYMFFEVIGINTTAALVSKKTVRRVRPLVYNENVPIEDKMTASATRSFYSGHTSHVSAMTFFTAKVINDLYPNSKWKIAAWAGAAVVPAVAGYHRYKAGKHFPTDIIVGYGVGAAIGVLIPQLHKIKKDNLKLGVVPLSDGAMLNFSFTF